MDSYVNFWNQDLGPGPASCHTRHSLLAIRGADARDFLQRICSQDVASLEFGQAAWTAFLTAKGRLEAVAVVGIGAEALWLECSDEVLQGVADLLDRYHFAEDLRIEACPDFAAVEIAGPSALEALELTPGTCRETDAGAVLFGFLRHGQSWARCHGPQEALDVVPGIKGLQNLPEGLGESLRLLRGELLFGTDADSKTLALEAGLQDHVSTTKGCYIGQEIVARIHTYGHVNRALTLLRIEDVATTTPGTTLHEPAEGEAVGRITSSALPPGKGYRLALGYLPEAFLEAGGELRLGGAEGARVRVLGFA